MPVKQAFQCLINQKDSGNIESWISGHDYKIEMPEPSRYAFIDWITATNTEIKGFYDFARYAIPKFKQFGFDVYDCNRGMSGYSHSFAIDYNSERVGSFAADELSGMGGLFQLTGTGCMMVQANWGVWCSLMHALSVTGFSITRLDVTADLKGAAWFNYQKTIVDLLSFANKGGFKVGRGSVAPSITQNGDWTDLILNDSGSYNPAIHCDAGLSFSVGRRNSVNSFIVYEKGKQLAGIGAIDTATAVDRSSLRIERRFGRGSGRSKVVIPFDFAIHCDEAFFYNCSGLRSFFQDFDDWLHGEGVKVPPVQKIDVVRVGTKVTKSVLHKLFWAARHSGRCVSTLVELGFSSSAIVDLLASGETIKGFVDDVTDCENLTKSMNRIKVNV